MKIAEGKVKLDECFLQLNNELKKGSVYERNLTVIKAENWRELQKVYIFII